MTTDATYRRDPSEAWEKGASGYADLLQGFTAQAAKRLIDLTASYAPYTAGSTVLDDGCGSGSMTLTLSEAYPAVDILATDAAPGMLKQLDERRLPNVRTHQADATNMASLGSSDGADRQYSHVLSTFMIQFTADPLACVLEMKRLLKPSGVLGLGTWGSVGTDNVIEIAGKKLDPSWEIPDPIGNAWPREEEGVEKILSEMGFEDVKVVTMRPTLDADHDIHKVYDYFFEGTHPWFKKVLEHWNNVGRKQELREAVDRILAEMPGTKGYGMNAIVVVARKP